jgi:hypothetical protein
MNLFLTLLVLHALCDYPLQGEFLAHAKNRTAQIPGVPWFQAMGAHALIQGGAVAMITGSWALGVAETICHFLIDDAKCRGLLSYNQDQFLHVGCKAVWVIVFMVTCK